MIPRPMLTPFGIDLLNFFKLEQKIFNDQWQTLLDARRHPESKAASLPFGININLSHQDSVQWQSLVKNKLVRNDFNLLKEQVHYWTPASGSRKAQYVQACILASCLTQDPVQFYFPSTLHTPQFPFLAVILAF
jgi:hypothetical protein